MVEARPWIKGDDDIYRPTPPYRVGEVVGCEGCGRPVRVTERAANVQWVYDECRKCAADYDAWLQSQE